jgi:hypothetical protein
MILTNEHLNISESQSLEELILPKLLPTSLTIAIGSTFASPPSLLPHHHHPLSPPYYVNCLRFINKQKKLIKKLSFNQPYTPKTITPMGPRCKQGHCVPILATHLRQQMRASTSPPPHLAPRACLYFYHSRNALRTMQKICHILFHPFFFSM